MPILHYPAKLSLDLKQKCSELFLPICNSFLEECATLKETQEVERAEQRQKWRDYRAEREAVHQKMEEKRNIDHTQILQQSEGLQQHLIQVRNND